MRVFASEIWAAALALSSIACGGAEVPLGPADAGTAPDPIGDPITLISQSLTPSAPYFAAALGEDVLAAYDDRVERVATATTTRLDAPPGRIVGAGRWSGGVLVAASDGFYVLEAGRLDRSPLSDALSGMRPAGLVSVDRGGERELWIAGASGLALWSAGRVRMMTPGSLPVQDCDLAYGAPVAGAPALWAACAGRVFGLVGQADDFVAHSVPELDDAVDIAVDGSGVLWIVRSTGAVLSRATDGALISHNFTGTARAVAADHETPDVWFETEAGLWRFDQTSFAPVEGLRGALHGPAGEGQVLLTNSGGLVRAAVRRVVRLSGLEQGALLEDVARVTAHPLQPDEVIEVRGQLDDAALPVDANWTVVLDPESIADGTHTLTLTAVYADGDEVQSSLRFSRYAGPPPTWVNDVGPLFEARCALCHGAQGSARRLDSALIWQDQIDIILDNLRNGRMPLPPTPLLDDEELGRIEGWVAAGYPEGE